MSRIRSFSLPKIGSMRKQDDAMSSVASPYQSGTSHSRESSGASTSSTPVTPTFSNRSHGLWHNSNSSFGTTPESPVNLTKSPLHDLPEDPEERDDDSFDFLRDSQDGSEIQDDDGPLCICDTPFCVHQNSQEQLSSTVSPVPEWSPGDDYDLSAQHSFKRQRSKERSTESLASRMSRRFPSMSKRWKDQPSTQVTNASVRSAPASRTPSLRLGNRKHTFGTQSESRTPPFSPVDTIQQPPDSARTSKVIPAPIEIPGTEVEDPVDYRELASTPLLPPTMDSNHNSQRDKIQSPLQSPKIAEPADGTFANHPRSTPNLPYIPTPPLSTKASIASFHRAGSDMSGFASDVPPMPLSDDNDPWAAKLGHANFQIMPEPYFPDQCNIKSCQHLRDDWETARKDYMRQAAPISEHYGPTSRTFKLTERKWAEIDAVWRANYELAKAQAGSPRESPECQPLPETTPLPKMTALPNDPEQPSKFPKIDESDIVGPMVQYARVQRQPTRRPSFLRLFTDPASLLGRSTFSMRR